MKDLFSGSLGKLNNHGGSRMFTTPNTILVQPEYEVATDVPSIAEFVTCSLDGKLWVFRRSRRYYVAVFRWNEDNQRLGFVKPETLSNTNFIGRGVDWLLTDTNIIHASDDEPYVFTANIFNDNGNSFLYSVLRSKDFPSGIDAITKKAWGLSETNGNSEGYGYFNRSALLQAVNKHYSLLPAVGDWHIIKNFLVRKADNPLTEAHNSMLNIRPLIPLEFNGSTPAYGCGFDNDIFITCYNGELWARGLYHIGRCYILPAVFDESGTPQEFYLYISPDYSHIAGTQGEKLNLGILKTDDSLYGFLTSQASSFDCGLCFKPDTPKIFETSTKAWQDFSVNHVEEQSDEEQQTIQNVQMFIDTLNHSGLVLHDDGAIFLDGNSYQCKGLRQWFSPAGTVEAVSEQMVISSFDNHVLATYPQQGFHRELLTGKKLPLSAVAHSGKILSIGVNDVNNVKSIHVNSIAANNGSEAIAWENVFKQSVNIKLLNSFSRKVDAIFATVEPYPIFAEQGCFDTWKSVIDRASLPDYDGDFDIWWGQHRGYWGWRYYEPWDKEFPLCPGIGYSLKPKARSIYGDFCWSFDERYYNETQNLFYIHPVSGIPIFFFLSWDDGNHNQIINNDLQGRLDFHSQNPVFDLPESITIQDGKIGYLYTHYSNDQTETRFKPMLSVPSEILDWQDNSSGNLTLQGVQIPENIPQNITCSASAIFSEKNSKANFACDIPSAFKSTNGNFSGALADFNSLYWGIYWQNFNYWNTNSLSDDEGDDEAYCTQGLHVGTADNENFFVFRSELHPDIFDFHNEVERSIL